MKVENDIQTLIHCSQISVVQIVIPPPKNHIDFFFFLSYTFPRFSPLVINLHMPSGGETKVVSGIVTRV